MDEKINLVPPRSSVEIQLPDGRVLSGPRGAKVGMFLETLEYDAQLIAAVVNGDLRELTYPINIEFTCDSHHHVRPGWRAYLSPLIDFSARDGIHGFVP